MSQKYENNSLLFQDEQAARMADRMLANSPSPGDRKRKRKSKIINADEEKNIKRMMDVLDDLSERTPPLFERSWYDTKLVLLPIVLFCCPCICIVRIASITPMSFFSQRCVNRERK